MSTPPPGDAWDRYTSFIERRRIAILLAAIALAALGTWLASRLELKTDFAELLPKHAPAVVELERIGARVGGNSTLVVAIEGGDWKPRQKFAEEAVAALKAKLPPGRVHFIDYKIDEARTFFERNKWLYAELDDLKTILERLKKKIEDVQKRELVVQLDDEPEYQFSVEDIKKKYQARTDEYGKFPDGYFITPDRTLQALLLRIPSSALGESSTDQIIDEVRGAMSSLEPGKRGYKILIGGDPVAAQEERAGIVEDILVVSVSSVVLVIVLMFAYYRSWRALLLIGAPVGVGTALAFGTARLTIGSINTNTAFLGSIILGNGINFGIIQLARYLEERREGLGSHDALRIAIQQTWIGTATAAAAAAIAYGSLMVTDFRGFSQFGFIGGIGMVFCWMATFTVMPAMIATLEGWWPMRVEKLRPVPAGGPALLGRFFSRYSRTIAVGGVLVTVLALAAAARFYRDPFEYDFRKLRADRSMKGGASALGVRVDRIFDGTRLSAGSPTLMLVDRPDQVDPLVEELHRRRKEGAYLDRVESIRSVLPLDQEKKVAVLDEIRSLLDRKVLGMLEGEEKKQALEYRPPDRLAALTVEDLPEIVTRPFVEKDGRRGLMLFAYPPPGNDYLDGKLLLKFADAIREVRLPSGETVHTSGHEVVLADILREILSDGPLATAASFIGVLLLVTLAFRATRDRALVLMTLLSGVAWMCGAGALLGIKVNMLNFVALPITFGIGVDYPVNVYRRHLSDEREDLARAIWSTGSAVAVCSLTTIIGYGSLLFADTRALNTFGLLAVVGELSTLAAGLIWMPSLVKLLEKRQGGR